MYVLVVIVEEFLDAGFGMTLASVIDFLRSFEELTLSYQRGHVAFAVLEQIGESGRSRQHQSLKLVNLDIRHESRIGEFHRESRFESVSPFKTIQAIRRPGVARKVVWKLVQVHHHRETGVWGAVFQQPSPHILEGVAKGVEHSAARNPPAPAAVGSGKPGRPQEHVERCKVRLNHGTREGLFGLALNRQIEVLQAKGPPPTTFFSHN